MNREIKFRAWDKEMIYFDVFNAGDFYQRHNWNTDKNPLMQFTGLKDKNGKEIYEGDIIESISYDHTRATTEVVYNPKDCAFTTKGGNLFGRYENEVIGNIYENPELII